MVLLGREAERGILARLVTAAADGLSGALVVYGDVGMGKTTLLGFAAEVDPDIRFTEIAGIETESQLPFAALHRLLLPLLDGLDDLPPNQRNAMAAAFGLSDQSPADVFLVGLATLSLLAAYAIPNGLLCVIRREWLDPESLQVLTFVARRLMADRTAMIFGFRGSSGISTTFAGIPNMEISGWRNPLALQLLSLSVPSSLNSQIARRIVAETNGCPLALIELAEELSAGQWVGADPLLEPVPIGRRLEEHYYRRTSMLPTAC